MARLFIFCTCFSTSSARAVDEKATKLMATKSAVTTTNERRMSPLLRRDDELGAPVVLAPHRRAVVVDRLRRTEAARLHALGLDAVIDEERLDALGAILRQDHVVLERAARIGMPFDAHLDLGPRL